MTDTKALVMAALKAAIPDADIVSVRPDGDGAPPERGVIRIVATGGQGRHRRVLYTGQVTVNSYAATTGQAMRLALRADTAINALVKGDDYPVTRVTGNAPNESPDPDTAWPRVTATYQITTRTA